MPTYTYRCSECGTFDWIHAMGEELLYCPKCGLPDFKKVFNNVSISFKGSGFYSTDKNSSSPKSSSKTKDFDF